MTSEVRVLLDTTQKVNEFCDACQKHLGEVEVYSGRYIVNGKSIMGLYSLDLTMPVKVEFHDEVSEDVGKIVDKFRIAN